jgi:hypothetical protein
MSGYRSGVKVADKLAEMTEPTTEASEQESSRLAVLGTVTLLSLLCLLGLCIYIFVHPIRHEIVLILMGLCVGPLGLALLLRKTRLRGMFERRPLNNPKSFKAELRRRPSVLLVLPLIAIALSWVSLLIVLGMKKGGDTKDFVNKNLVLCLIWGNLPILASAYFCVHLHAFYLGTYIAGTLIWFSVNAAVGGLTLEDGVIGFFGTYKAQASPLIILAFALISSISFGILHFVLWSIWPTECVNMHGLQDALYFSMVTIATVGYGDILPVGHAARWLCVTEIASGVLLLVVGVSASMSVWIQQHQPPAASITDVPKEAPPIQAAPMEAGQPSEAITG